jgi:hypothetical protein
MPATLATREVEIRRITMVPGQPRQTVFEIPAPK